MLYGESVVILSGGPSLLKHMECGQEFIDEVETFDTIVAVNEHAETVEADWWVFIDQDPFRTTTPKGKPVIFGKRDWPPVKFHEKRVLYAMWPKVFQHDQDPEIPRLGPYETIPCYDTGVREGAAHTGTKSDLPMWNRFGGLAALGLAYIIKPKVVRLYGYDMAGDGGSCDKAHPAQGRNRDTRRWTLELPIFGWWMKEFEKAKIVVERA